MQVWNQTILETIPLSVERLEFSSLYKTQWTWKWLVVWPFMTEMRSVAPQLSDTAWYFNSRKLLYIINATFSLPSHILLIKMYRSHKHTFKVRYCKSMVNRSWAMENHNFDFFYFPSPTFQNGPGEAIYQQIVIHIIICYKDICYI